MNICALTSEAAYFQHVLPLVKSLGIPVQAPKTLQARIEATGVTYSPVKPPDGQITLVAGWKDYRATQGPVIYLEHGSGQTYQGAEDNPCYSGGKGLDRVILFLCPNETVAARWRARYDVPAVVVGSPKLDALRSVPVGTETAISFHWDCRVAPEARSAYKHYAPGFKRLSEEHPLIGHGHPRIIRRLRPIYEKAGIEVVEDFAEVVKRAGTYLVDNSSSGWEMAELGRRVIWLNAPFYRRHVHHGLRFWTSMPQVDNVEEIPEALENAPTIKPSGVYDYEDATRRAVEAICQMTSFTP